MCSLRRFFWSFSRCSVVRRRSLRDARARAPPEEKADATRAGTARDVVRGFAREPTRRRARGAQTGPGAGGAHEAARLRERRERDLEVMNESDEPPVAGRAGRDRHARLVEAVQDFGALTCGRGWAGGGGGGAGPDSS